MEQDYSLNVTFIFSGGENKAAGGVLPAAAARAGDVQLRMSRPIDDSVSYD